MTSHIKKTPACQHSHKAEKVETLKKFQKEKKLTDRRSRVLVYVKTFFQTPTHAVQSN